MSLNKQDIESLKERLSKIERVFNEYLSSDDSHPIPSQFGNLLNMEGFRDYWVNRRNRGRIE